jgi:hypothetical protein
MDDIHHIEYLDNFAGLPSATPRNHPHILDLTTFKTLMNFLDATSPFRIVFKFKSNHIDDSLVVMRKDDQVVVSQLTSRGEHHGLTR